MWRPSCFKYGVGHILFIFYLKELTLMVCFFVNIRHFKSFGNMLSFQGFFISFKFVVSSIALVFKIVCKRFRSIIKHII